MNTLPINEDLIINTPTFVERLVDSYIQINRLLKKEKGSKELNVTSIPLQFLKYIKGFALLPKEILDYIYLDLLGYRIINTTYTHRLINEKKYSFAAYFMQLNKSFNLFIDYDHKKLISHHPLNITINDNIKYYSRDSNIPKIWVPNVRILSNNQESRITNIDYSFSGRDSGYTYQIQLVSNDINSIFNTPILKGYYNRNGGIDTVIQKLTQASLPHKDIIQTYYLFITEEIYSYDEDIAIGFNRFMGLTYDNEIINYDISKLRLPFLSEYFEDSYDCEDLLNPNFIIHNDIIHDFE